MIACVSPGYSHADHTLNTIRYAARLVEGISNGIKQAKEMKLQKEMSDVEEQKGEKSFGKRKATTSGDTKREKAKEPTKELRESPTKWEMKVTAKVEPKRGDQPANEMSRPPMPAKTPKTDDEE